MGRSLAELKRELGQGTQQILQQHFPDERHTGWTMGELSELMELERGGHTLVGYPALVDDGDAVTLQVFDSPEKAREIHRAGVRRLLAIAFRDRIRDLWQHHRDAHSHQNAELPARHQSKGFVVLPILFEMILIAHTCSS